MSSTLRAFTHPGLDKAAFLAELQSHADQDRIVQGQYWKGGRGCAVGCSLHSASVRLGLGTIEFGNHGLFETYLGIPRILARLEDRIFEELPVELARTWPMRFAQAIPQGADLSEVWNKFAPWLLREIALPATKTKRTRAAIIAVAEGFETGWATRPRDEVKKLAAAAAAAAAAADAAADAAAYAAAYAADAAAYAAAYAAYAAADDGVGARRSAFIRLSDQLLIFLSTAVAAPASEGAPA